MTMMKPGRLLASAAIAGLLAFAAAPANAVATCAEAGIENDLLANAGCQVGEASPPINADAVNLEMFFGFDDWEALGKDEGFPDNAGEFGTYELDFEGTALSGTWSLDGDVWEDFLNVMIILKDGAMADPGGWVGYLLVRADTSGTYSSPFCNIATSNCTGSNIKDISFGELYGSLIPLPAALPMFLLALGSLGFVARRRRQAAA